MTRTSALQTPQRHDDRDETSDPVAVEYTDTALLAELLDPSCPLAGRPLARRLLDRFGSVGDVLAADSGELCRIRGMETEHVSALRRCRLLAVALVRATARARPVMTSFQHLRDYAVAVQAHLPREQFRVLHLDRRNHLLEAETVASGTHDHAPVYVREVVRRALELSASAIILIHNHPSGDPSPSQADIEMTRRIVEAARVFDLQVHDHLIVSRGGTASLRSLGLM